MIAKHGLESDFHFRVLVEKLADKTFRATCLDWDIVAESDTADETLQELWRLIHAQWDFACRHGAQSSVWHPAPPELWEKYDQALSRQNLSRLPFVQKPEKFSDIAYAS